MFAMNSELKFNPIGNCLRLLEGKGAHQGLNITQCREFAHFVRLISRLLSCTFLAYSTGASQIQYRTQLAIYSCLSVNTTGQQLKFVSSYLRSI